MKKISPQEQLVMFETFGIIYNVAVFIESGEEFCEEALLIFLDLPSPLTEEHVIAYLEHGYELPESGQVKLLTNPQLRKYAVPYYMLEHPFAPKAQMVLFNLDDDYLLAKNYLHTYINKGVADRNISPEFLKKAKELKLVDNNVASEWDMEILSPQKVEQEVHW